MMETTIAFVGSPLIHVWRRGRQAGNARCARRRHTPCAQAGAASRRNADAANNWEVVNDWSKTSQSASNGPNAPPGEGGPRWEKMNGCDVYRREAATCAIAFIGGFGTGTSAPTFYGNLLRKVSDATNATMIAYPLPVAPSTKHGDMAHAAGRALSAAYVATTTVGEDALPLFGMGHSLGCKLLLLACVDETARAQLKLHGNVLLSFSNALLQQALPILGSTDARSAVQTGISSISSLISSLRVEGVSRDLSRAKTQLQSLLQTAQDSLEGGLEFSPSREQTLALAATRYNVAHNLLVRFGDDSLDDGEALCKVLRTRFGADSGAVMWREMAGTHVTPVTPDLGSGDFSSLGNPQWDEMVREKGGDVSRELDECVTVVAAFVRLQLELLSAKSGRR